MWTIVEVAHGHYRWGLMSPEGEIADWHCRLGAALGHAALRNGYLPKAPALPAWLDCECPQAIHTTTAEQIAQYDARPLRPRHDA